MGFPGFPLILFLCLASLVSRFSFILALQGNGLRLVAWLALLSLSACGGNLSVKCDFLCGLRLREMPCFKGFASVSTIKEEKSFSYCQKGYCQIPLMS